MIEQYSAQSQLDNAHYELELSDAQKKITFSPNLFHDSYEKNKALLEEKSEIQKQIIKHEKETLELKSAAKEYDEKKIVKYILKHKNSLLKDEMVN